MDQIALDNLLLELSGNMILPVLVRGFALHAVSTETLERSGATSPELMASINHHNEQLLNAIQWRGRVRPVAGPQQGRGHEIARNLT
jgi:hypothetical protein